MKPPKMRRSRGATTDDRRTQVQLEADQQRAEKRRPQPKRSMQPRGPRTEADQKGVARDTIQKREHAKKAIAGKRIRAKIDLRAGLIYRANLTEEPEIKLSAHLKKARTPSTPCIGPAAKFEAPTAPDK